MKVRVKLLGEIFDTKKTNCPRCGKLGTNITPDLGVLPCDKCIKKEGDDRIRDHKSINSKLEYFATPLWKVAGLKPNASEKTDEAKRVWSGKSHLDLQKERLAKAPQRYDSNPLKQKIFKGELRGKYD